ncbi:MAG: cytochrome C, partial [Microvirgula sp.]
MKTPLLLSCLLTLLTLPALAGDHDREGRHRYRQVPPNASYRAECASCHMAYPPGMLPAASWRRMMGGLDRHFGENASLDAATRDDITAFLVLWSA